MQVFGQKLSAAAAAKAAGHPGLGENARFGRFGRFELRQ
jgi:hypothetical protein